jgi:pyrroline-5-carboxylate reductase
MPTARRYAFIGGGTMAEAILRAILEAAVAAPEAVVVSEPVEARRAALAALGARTTASNEEAVEGADVILLAVKPAVVPAALAEIGPGLKAEQLVISIAAGTPLATLEALLPAGVPVVRVMPNLCLSVRAGASALCCGRHAGAEHAAAAREIFAAGGRVVEVPESLVDAVTGLSGSGPGYVMLIIEALADGGVLSGLPRDVALTLAAQTVFGAAKLLLERDEHPAAWKDRVATPGGTTIVGLAALEAGGLRSALIEAVAAATRRARELSEQ